MASPAPQTNVIVPPPAHKNGKNALPKFLWNAVRIIIFLVVLSRGYALLIAYKYVPDFPDPVLRTFAAIYDGSDRLLTNGLGSVGNLILGNVIFGGLVRYYAAKPLTEAQKVAKAEREEKERVEKEKKIKIVEKKMAGVTKKNAIFRDELPNEKEGSIDLRLGRAEDSNLKRNMVIVGRVMQCVVFMGLEWSDGLDVSARVLDLGISAVIIVLEVSGLKWDGGLVEMLSGSLGDLMGKDVVGEKEEEKKEEDVKLKLR